MYRNFFKRQSAFIRDFWRRFRKHKPAVVAVIVFAGICSVAILAPYVAPFNPKKLSIDFLEAPSSDHLFGTDHLGRDVLSRVIWGSQISLIVGFGASLFSVSIGLVVGSIAGYYGGVVDKALMWVSEALQMIPHFPLILLFAAIFGGSVQNIIIVFGATFWPVNARVIRAEFLSLKEKEFVEASRAMGAGDRRIILSEILPNAFPSIVILTSLRIGYAVFTEASLSFLGLGDPNFVSWGQMLLASMGFLRVAWWVSVFPGFAIFITILALNLIGDGVNDALNPRLRGAL